MPNPNSFTLDVAAWIGPAWSALDAPTRRRLLDFAATRALVRKRQELAQGVDISGQKLLERLRPRADGASGPPLSPHLLESRSQKLLKATPAPKAGTVTLWWAAGWGTVLGYHRQGIPSSVGLRVRDVIGFTPADLTKLKAEVLARWRLLTHGLSIETGPQVEHHSPGNLPMSAAPGDNAIQSYKGVSLDDLVKHFGAGSAPPPVAAPPAPKPKLPVLGLAPEEDFPLLDLASYTAPPPPTPKPAAKPAPPPPPKPKPPAPKLTAKPQSVAPPPPAPKPVAKPQPKPVPQPAPKPQPKPTPGAFPADPHALEFVKSLGGSTGAVLVKDPATGKLYVKKTGANPGHLKEEAHADALYQALGIPVPKAQLYETGSGPVKLAEFHEGKALRDLSGATRKKAEEELRKHFVADALLGNWDVVGMGADNILVTPDGKVIRIDNGGSLRYRAQGEKKTGDQWNGFVSELESLRNPEINPQTAAVFGKLSQAEIHQQIHAILKQQDKILAAAPQDLQAVLKERLADLARRVAPKAVPAAATHPAPAPAAWTPRPAAEFKSFEGQKSREIKEWGQQAYEKWAQALPDAEREAIQSYGGDLYRAMNGLARGVPWKEINKDENTYGLTYYMEESYVRKMIERADAGLRSAKLPEAIVAHRGIADHRKLGIADLNELEVGQELTEGAFTSTSLDPDVASGYADVGTHPVHLEVRIPRGSAGAYLDVEYAEDRTLASFESEKEYLLPLNAKYRVVETGLKRKYVGKEIPVVVVELIP